MLAEKNSLSDRAHGLIMGAVIGDSIGSKFEFSTRPPTEDELVEIMTMPGGGPHGVLPGQVTDDGELMMCLLRALVDMKEFDVDRIAHYYREWIMSNPFDKGGTISNALEALREKAEASRAVA